MQIISWQRNGSKQDRKDNLLSDYC